MNILTVENDNEIEHMKVTYIYHSCYLLELEDFSVLFDYYQDAKRDDGTYWIKDYLLSKKEDLYVLCTHSHADHYNAQIFEWGATKKNIKYILSKEVAEVHTIPQDDRIVLLDILQTYQDDNLRVITFGSTDVGGSFGLDIGDKKIFHAGDLNNWHWNEEVSKIEAAGYENSYLCELELVAEHTNQINLVMFPIDPRLGKDYMRGAEQFVNRVAVDYLLPMHFGEHYDKANEFERYARLQNCEYLAVTKKGQTFKL